MSGESTPPENDIKAQRALIQKLIANQYRVVHHSERLITDFAKIASIILGVASFFGVPQILMQETTSIPIDAFAVTLLLFSGTCLIVIIYALSRLGGWDIEYEESPSLSLWWYSDKELQNMKKDEAGDRLVRSVAKEILERTRIEENELELRREAGTLALLYARAEEQFKASRQMRNVFILGLLLSLIYYFGTISEYFIPWIPSEFILLSVTIILALAGAIQRSRQKVDKRAKREKS